MDSIKNNEQQEWIEFNFLRANKRNNDIRTKLKKSSINSAVNDDNFDWINIKGDFNDRLVNVATSKWSIFIQVSYWRSCSFYWKSSELMILMLYTTVESATTIKPNKISLSCNVVNTSITCVYSIIKVAQLYFVQCQCYHGSLFSQSGVHYKSMKTNLKLVLLFQ